MSNTDLRSSDPVQTPQAAPGPDEQAALEAEAHSRLVAQFDEWCAQNELNDQTGEQLLATSFEFLGGPGIELEIRYLEGVVQAGLTRDGSVAPHIGVRACHTLTTKRRQLEQARHFSLLDAATRLDRLLRNQVKREDMSKSRFAHHTLSWRVQPASVQGMLAKMESAIAFGKKLVKEAHAKERQDLVWARDLAAQFIQGAKQGPPAAAATAKVG